MRHRLMSCAPVTAVLAVVVVGAPLGSALAKSGRGANPDPRIVIPTCPKAPAIDGRIGEDEWRYAAVVSLFEEYGSSLMRMEQPLFYVCRHGDDLYVAMDSIDSNTNTIVAACMQHDHIRIIGDDCLELMLAPGAGKDLERFDFPTYYFALNAIGTIWDAKFVPLCNEVYNSWESGGQWASTVDGTRWMCEMRIPLANIASPAPKDGDTWRLNFDRTYHGYSWSAWKAGALNDARTGGDAVFDSTAPAVRLVDPSALADGKLRLVVEVANGTTREQTVTLKLACTGQRERGQETLKVGSDQKTVTVKPGDKVEVVLGHPFPALLPWNTLVVEAVGAGDKPLLAMQRQIRIPAPRFVKRVAREVPLIYAFPRYLPSLERLAVTVNYTAWARKTGYVGPAPKAMVRVFRKGEAESGRPVLEGVLTEFKDAKGVLRLSTQALPEGDYEVRVQVIAPSGEAIATDHDWFEKRTFEWITHKRGVGTRVPKPYTPLAVRGTAVEPWGRRIDFAPGGLPRQVVSQGRELLTGPIELQATRQEQKVDLRPDQPLKFAAVADHQVEATAGLAGDGLHVAVHSTTEYDGFTLFRLTYGPASDPVTIDRLRLRIPVAFRHAKFYSAAGDTLGVCINGAVTPDRQGPVFDSLRDTRSVCGTPSFASLFWVGDYDVSFCYAADCDQGWIPRDDAPGVEAVREADTLAIYLNFVNRRATLDRARIVEFALQAGPLKPRPEGWRGVQFGGNPDDAPVTWEWTRHCGTGLAGGLCLQHPGFTPEDWKRSAEYVGKRSDQRVPVGYYYYATAPKGQPATRVFRGEWGIDRYTWEAAKEVSAFAWSHRRYGDNRDLYTLMYVQPSASYIDFLAYCWDETLKHTDLCGFYDDVGTPRSVFDEELGIGYVREDGRPIHSAGIWLYRQRWKRAAYLLDEHGRPNFLCDSQHGRGHFMPAYGFIGIWAPCESGYYNPFPDRDNLGFYQSLERYAAYNPAAAFGQIPAIGMSSPQWEESLTRRDARNMMMLAMLHDHDVGSWGHRNLRVIAGLRYARNLFQPWQPDVRFLGYWESREKIACDAPDIRVSAWYAPRGMLLVAGNLSQTAVKAGLQPDWKQFGLDPGGLTAVDAEDGQAIPLSVDKGLTVTVAARDLRLVLIGRPGQFKATRPRLGQDLPGPKQVLSELSDPFEGPDLKPVWEKDLHEGQTAAGIIDGRLCIQGHHYGYAHVRRPLGVDHVSVQVLVLRGPTGCSDEWNAGLILWWDKGGYVQAIPGTGSGKFVYALSGAGRRRGSEINRTSAPGWFPLYHNWVKIVLQPDKVLLFASADGRSWVKDWEVPRPKELAGPPRYILLGNGSPGPNPHFDNVWSEHFQPTGGSSPMFFSDLIVGRE